jgi:hypothetical protein
METGTLTPPDQAWLDPTFDSMWSSPPEVNVLDFLPLRTSKYLLSAISCFS